jgi:LAO/AO transport system kinase
MNTLSAGVLAGDRRAVARLLTLVENDHVAARPDIAALYSHTGRAHVVGITGAPGSGKSTLVNRLAVELRRRERTVGIIAVDPSSPFSGGAILGDRIRMQEAAADPGVFIRSMASRGSLGGLSQATAGAITILDAFGRDAILVETVGVGQDEIDIAAAAHTTVVLQVPTLGDDVQIMKAGILEVADVLVINKADLPGAERVKAALDMMLDLGQSDPNWRPAVLPATASSGQGVPAVLDAIDAHVAYLRASGRLMLRLQSSTRAALIEMLGSELTARAIRHLPAGRLDEIVRYVATREMDPFSALDALLQAEATA